MIGTPDVNNKLVSIFFRSLALVLTAGCAALPNMAAANPPIQIKDGFVRGIETPTVDKFLGIPYAAPPVGDLRWKPPESPSSWSKVLNANKFGSNCAQTAQVVGASSNSEDCLFLNVYVPKGPAEPDNLETQGSAVLRGRAVLVWIHGVALWLGKATISTLASFPA